MERKDTTATTSDRITDSKEEDKNEEPMISLEEYLENQEKESRLTEQLFANKLGKQCRYNDGYIYQEVYACKTCYLDNLKRLIPDFKEGQLFSDLQIDHNLELLGKVKPHGYCFGCMMTCHQGHDQFDLGQRLDFRCDCGNGRMPSSCQLNDAKIDYENNENKYNQNFFEKYCYCGVNNQVEKEVNNFMIKCQSCEEWYHFKHLNPPIDEVEDQLGDDYILICSSCVGMPEMKRKILGYSKFFHENALDKLALMPKHGSNKRLKISSETEAEVHSKVICSQTQHQEEFEAFDLLIDSDFASYLCSCPVCQLAFLKLSKIIQAFENLNEDELQLHSTLCGQLAAEQPISSDDPQNPATEVCLDPLVRDLTKAMNDNSVPHEAQIIFAEKYQQLKGYLQQFFTQVKEDSNSVLTMKDAKKFVDGLQNLK